MFAFSGYSQDISKFEIYGAFSIMRITKPDDSTSLMPIDTISIFLSVEKHRYHYLSGLKAGIAYNLNQYVGIVGEFGWHHSGDSFFQTLFEDAGWPDLDYAKLYIEAIENLQKQIQSIRRTPSFHKSIEAI